MLFNSVLPVALGGQRSRQPGVPGRPGPVPEVHEIDIEREAAVRSGDRGRRPALFAQVGAGAGRFHRACDGQFGPSGPHVVRQRPIAPRAHGQEEDAGRPALVEGPGPGEVPEPLRVLGAVVVDVAYQVAAAPVEFNGGRLQQVRQMQRLQQAQDAVGADGQAGTGDHGQRQVPRGVVVHVYRRDCHLPRPDECGARTAEGGPAGARGIGSQHGRAMLDTEKVALVHQVARVGAIRRVVEVAQPLVVQDVPGIEDAARSVSGSLQVADDRVALRMYAAGYGTHGKPGFQRRVHGDLFGRQDAFPHLPALRQGAVQTAQPVRQQARVQPLGKRLRLRRGLAVDAGLVGASVRSGQPTRGPVQVQGVAQPQAPKHHVGQDRGVRTGNEAAQAAQGADGHGGIRGGVELQHMAGCGREPDPRFQLGAAGIQNLRPVQQLPTQAATQHRQCGDVRVADPDVQAQDFLQAQPDGVKYPGAGVRRQSVPMPEHHRDEMLQAEDHGVQVLDAVVFRHPQKVAGVHIGWVCYLAGQDGIQDLLREGQIPIRAVGHQVAGKAAGAAGLVERAVLRGVLEQVACPVEVLRDRQGFCHGLGRCAVRQIRSARAWAVKARCMALKQCSCGMAVSVRLRTSARKSWPKVSGTSEQSTYRVSSASVTNR